MIKSFIRKNESIFRICLMALIGLIIAFNFISIFGNYSNNAGSNFGLTLDFVVYNGLLGLLLFCIITKKDEFTSFLGFAYLTYYVISTLLNVDSPFYSFYDGAHGTVIARAIFNMFALFTFVAIVVLAIIEKTKNREFKIANKISIIDILALCYLFFMLMVFIMEMCVYGVFKYGWTSIMGSFNSRLFMPMLVVLGYYMYQLRFVDAPQDETYVAFEEKEPQQDMPNEDSAE